jgi:hypothetical protein
MLYVIIGACIAGAFNAPGSWPDSHVARPIYKLLYNHTLEGFYLIAETAFLRETNNVDRCIKAPLKQRAQLPQDPEVQANIQTLNQQLLSFQQNAEWGMQALQGSFEWLHVPLSLSIAEGCTQLIELCVRLHNVHANC